MVAARIGQMLHGGEVIELTSDVGGGKTTFVRGLAAGFGSPDAVASPTFTLSKVYMADDKAMHHYDLYRVEDFEVISHELAEILEDDNAVVVIEWPQTLQKLLPDARLRVHLEPVAEDQHRKLTLQAPSTYEYVLEQAT